MKPRFTTSPKKSRLSISVTKTPKPTIYDKINKTIASEMRLSPTARTSLISYKKDLENETDKKQFRTTATTAATTLAQKVLTYAKLPKNSR